MSVPTTGYGEYMAAVQHKMYEKYGRTEDQLSKGREVRVGKNE